VLERLQIFVFRSRVEFALQAQTHVNGVPASSGSTSESAAYQPGPVELRYLFSDQPGDGSSDEWKLEELRRQVVWLGAQSSEKFIPQMLGYDQIGAVSFSKGCYPGQEIVARAHYLGKVKRKPQLVMAEGLDEAATGEKVELCRDGQWSGAVVVDQSPGRSGGTLIFTVAPDHEAPVEMLRYQGHDYRCATI
jgi:folate-binding protein YgfZ